MDRRRALDKLRKLLALAGSPNPHEALSARKRAESFMSHHHLTEADLEAEEATGYHELSLGHRGWSAAWRFALVTVAARARGVEAVALEKGRRRKVRICGERARVRQAHELYLELEKVIRDLEKLAIDEYGDELGDLVMGNSSRDITDAFRQGAVIGLAAVVDADRRRREPSPSQGEGRKNREGASIAGRKKIFEGAQVGLVVREGRAEHAEKIREKYAPRERPVAGLHEVSETLVWMFGRRLAVSRVTFSDDGRAIVRKTD